jgi:hypothetical protein
MIRAGRRQLALPLGGGAADWEAPERPASCWRCGRRRPWNALGDCRRCGADLFPRLLRRFRVFQIVNEYDIAGERFAVALAVTPGRYAVANRGVSDGTGKLAAGTPCRRCGTTIPLGQPCLVTFRGTFCAPSCDGG